MVSWYQLNSNQFNKLRSLPEYSEIRSKIIADNSPAEKEKLKELIDQAKKN